MPEQLILPLKQPAYSPETFVEGQANHHGLFWVRHSHLWPGRICIIYGPEGCGKTHLAHVWASALEQELLWLSSLSKKDFPLKWSPYVVVDWHDTEPGNLSGPAWMNVLTQWHEQKIYVLMLARHAPGLWDIPTPDVKSRLNSVAQARIDHPDDALLEKLIPQWFSWGHLRVHPTVVRFLIRHSDRSWSKIRRHIDQLVKHTLSHHGEVTMSTVKRILKEEELI